MDTAYHWGSLKLPVGHSLRYFHAPPDRAQWYCVIDIVQALGQPGHSAHMAAQKIPPEHKTKFLIDNVPHLAVSRVALVEMIMRSRGPRAAALRGWARWWLGENLGGEE